MHENWKDMSNDELQAEIEAMTERAQARILDLDLVNALYYIFEERGTESKEWINRDGMSYQWIDGGSGTTTYRVEANGVLVLLTYYDRHIAERIIEVFRDGDWTEKLITQGREARARTEARQAAMEHNRLVDQYLALSPLVPGEKAEDRLPW